MKLYRNIRDLLKEYRQSYKCSQEYLSEMLELSQRTIRRWETDKNAVNIENEHLLTERLKIPFFVIHSLNADIPIYYNLKTRRYSFSEYTKEFINKELLKKAEPPNQIERLISISLDKEMDNILEYDHNIYHTDNPVNKSILKKASLIMPGLNLYAKDSFGYYAGHLVVLPLKNEKYELLKCGYMSEGDLTESDLEIPNQTSMTSLYINSVYCNCLDTSIMLFRKALNNFRDLTNLSVLDINSYVSGYVVTKDGIELANKFGFIKVYENKEEYIAFQTECVPTFFEQKIKNLRIYTS